MALVVARILSPRSKLSTAAALQSETAKHTLAEELELGEVDVHQLYAAMDWLFRRVTTRGSRVRWSGTVTVVTIVVTGLRLFTVFCAIRMDGRLPSKYFPATPQIRPHLRPWWLGSANDLASIALFSWAIEA
jgi:hypothetical protein